MVKRFDIEHTLSYLTHMTTITVSSKYQIVIPKEFRNLLGIKSGTRLQAIPDSQGIRLVKEPEIDEIKGLIQGMAVEDAAIREERDREMA
jgi:AbrB family looped-hinge helix DNA binding protein